MPPVVIETPRLVLRPLRADDLVALERILLDPEVTQYLGDGERMTPEKIAAGLHKTLDAYANGAYRRFGIVERESGRLVGYAGIMSFDGTDDIELYYTLGRDSWGRGYATEAARAVAQWAFRMLALPRLHAVARPENVKSHRVLEKLGMRFTGMAWHYGANMRCYQMDAPETAADAPAPGAGASN